MGRVPISICTFFFGRRNHTLKNGIRQDRIQIKKFKTEKEIYLQTRAGPNLAIPPTIATNVALFLHTGNQHFENLFKIKIMKIFILPLSYLLHTGKGISTYSQGCPTLWKCIQNQNNENIHITSILSLYYLYLTSILSLFFVPTYSANYCY